MTTSASGQKFVQELLHEIETLRARVSYLEKNPPKRKQKLSKDARDEKRATAHRNYEVGGCWYYRTNEYAELSKQQLVAYHKKYPKSKVGPKGLKYKIKQP